MLKKLILNIIIALLIVTSIVLLIYNFALKKPATIKKKSTTITERPTQPITTPTVISKLTAITDKAVFWPVFDSDTNKILYFYSNGNLFSSDLDGKNIKKISSLILNNLVKVIWAPASKDKIIAVFNENGVNKKYLYNYQTGISIPLNDNILWANWSPDSQKIVYQHRDLKNDSNTISISNPDGSNWKNIFKTRLEDLVINWPTDDKISIQTPVSGLSQGLVYTVSPSTGDFTKVLSDFYGLNAKWSPKADKILFSNTDNNGKKLTLSLADNQGAAVKKLDFPTLVDKCVWSLDNKTIFCAVPDFLSTNAIWPDDYYKNKLIVSDIFYQYNTETGSKTKIFERPARAEMNINYDAQNLFLSAKEDYLFFTNKNDSKLYRLKLY